MVTGNVKFHVRRKTVKAAYEEFQEHGYEVDLVAARRNRLVLAEVKSYLGSYGVSRQGFLGLADPAKSTHYQRYKVLNDPELRAAIIELAAVQYGYPRQSIETRLYVGKFANGHEEDVRAHLGALVPPVRVFGLGQIMSAILAAADRKTYTNDPVVMTVKALKAAGMLADTP